ncbi:hypothetical protein VB735_14655 [Halotia wernerae UHCC 0503]|nr:hypothetical protein [Halotia wernerae UHCC 0503]
MNKKWTNEETGIVEEMACLYTVKEASAKGRKASALCRKQGIGIERINDPRFGKVGLYPESVLIEVFCANQN